MRDAGWATGIFGKWHLGDCYPMRASDQGFEKSLVHRGGGIGQPPDPPGGEGKYTDPVLFHNGERVDCTGYCTDVYFDSALEWIEKNHRAGRSFFTYIPTNAPHGPFNDVPAGLLAEYETMDLGNDRFPREKGHKLPEKANAYPEQLSGGQKQRAAMARALAMDPKIMLFDERTSALDAEMIRAVLDVMLDLAREGMAMVVVSHEMSFARAASDRMILLADGSIVEEGEPEQIFTSPREQRTKDFLGHIL